MAVPKTCIFPSVNTAHPFQPLSINTQPINPRPSTNIPLLIALFLTGLATGFTNLPSPTLLNPPFPELTPDLQTLTTTFLPTTLGAILSASLLDPLLRPSIKLQPHSVLAIVSLLTALAHASLLILSFTEWESIPFIVTVVIHLLLGAGNAVGLMVGTFLCDRMVTRLGGLYAAVALGGVCRVVVAECLEKAGCGFAIGGGERGGEVVAMVLGLVAAAAAAAAAGGRRAAASSPREVADEEKVGEGVTVFGEVELEGVELCLTVRDEKKVINLFSEMDRRDGYPPPASRTTVLGALFAFAYHAAVVMIPAWLVSSIGEFGNNKPTLKFTTAAVWGGIVVGRCVLLPWYECIGKAKHLVSWALTFTASLLLLSWLFLGTVKGLMAVGALAGLLLGPVYPLALGIVLHEMDDHEKQSGVGIVVAFGSAGALAGACINLLVAFGGIPSVLSLFIAGVYSGMLLCWNGLADGRER